MDGIPGTRQLEWGQAGGTGHSIRHRMPGFEVRALMPGDRRCRRLANHAKGSNANPVCTCGRVPPSRARRADGAGRTARGRDRRGRRGGRDPADSACPAAGQALAVAADQRPAAALELRAPGGHHDDRGEAAPTASPRVRLKPVCCFNPCRRASARAPHPERLEPRQHFLREVLELADVVDEAERHAAEAGVVEPLDLCRDIVG